MIHIRLNEYFYNGVHWLVKALGCAAVLALTGCAASLDDKTYSRDEARQVQTVQFGTLEAVNRVTIEGNRSAFGGIGGGAIGGIAGSGIGSGTGRSLATAVGAVLGSIAGREVEEQATRANGAELTIRMDDGRLISVVQEVNDLNDFVIGERVKLLTNAGKVRAMPLTTKPPAPVKTESGAGAATSATPTSGITP